MSNFLLIEFGSPSAVTLATALDAREIDYDLFQYGERFRQNDSSLFSDLENLTKKSTHIIITGAGDDTPQEAYTPDHYDTLISLVNEAYLQGAHILGSSIGADLVYQILTGHKLPAGEMRCGVVEAQNMLAEERKSLFKKMPQRVHIIMGNKYRIDPSSLTMPALEGRLQLPDGSFAAFEHQTDEKPVATGTIAYLDKSNPAAALPFLRAVGSDASQELNSLTRTTLSYYFNFLQLASMREVL